MRISIDKPQPKDIKRGVHYHQSYPTAMQREGFVENETRRRWRALLLVIKAKLEAVTSGIATLEDEFLAYTVMPNGQTMAEWVAPQMKEMMATGQMPPLLMAAQS